MCRQVISGKLQKQGQRHDKGQLCRQIDALNEKYIISNYFKKDHAELDPNPLSDISLHHTEVSKQPGEFRFLYNIFGMSNPQVFDITPAQNPPKHVGSNFSNPENLFAVIRWTLGFCLGVSSLAVVLRIWGRFFLQRVHGLEDCKYTRLRLCGVHERFH
jgi:hypothetical protein